MVELKGLSGEQEIWAVEWAYFTRRARVNAGEPDHAPPAPASQSGHR